MTAFFDTNLFIYAISSDPRATEARRLIEDGGVISVQVLNEFIRVCRRKLRLDWPVIENGLAAMRRAVDHIEPLTDETHGAALEIARRDGLDIHDAMIVAAAMQAGCSTLFSEDLQHGRRFGGLLIRNPFAVG